jgi:hypothetical protein
MYNNWPELLQKTRISMASGCNSTFYKTYIYVSPGCVSSVQNTSMSYAAISASLYIRMYSCEKTDI